MRLLLCAILCSGCTFDLIVPANKTEAGLPDASDIADASMDATNPNAWLGQFNNLSVLLDNCQRLIGDSGVSALNMEYYYDASTYQSAVPVLLCSTDITCDVEALLVNADGLYQQPAPNLFSTNDPNRLATGCQLVHQDESYLMSYYTDGIYGIEYDHHYPDAGEFDYLTQCHNQGGTVYVVSVLLYGPDFRVMVDKDNNFVFKCRSY